mgnify:CR=1 FL=1
MKTYKDDQKTIANLLSGKVSKKYQGKEVVVMEGKVYLLPENDEQSKNLINKLIQEHPGLTPTITFVPKHGTYILLIQK